MRVLGGHPRGWDPPPEGSAVSIGVYDGVHLGHQRVIGELVAAGREEGRAAGVITFDVHPLAVVAPGEAPELLTGLDQRLELFERLGLSLAAVLPFREVRDLGPEEFVEEVLMGALGARLVVVGEDFRFGKSRAGDLETLRALGGRHGFEVRALDLVEEAGTPISSSSIREWVRTGEMERAARALGRWFEVRGEVVEGAGRGKDLGVPTANLHLPSERILPARGVYAGYVRMPRGELPAAVNVGIRPMFPSERELVEAHVIGFEGDLYGRPLTVGFLRRLREERNYPTVEELVTQIRRDIEQTLEVTAGIL